MSLSFLVSTNTAMGPIRDEISADSAEALDWQGAKVKYLLIA